jgi:hypothetical protein
MLPTAALATPIGITASLLDITGTVMSCYGRRDTTTAQRPYLELVLVSGTHNIRVSEGVVCYKIAMRFIFMTCYAGCHMADRHCGERGHWCWCDHASSFLSD